MVLFTMNLKKRELFHLLNNGLGDWFSKQLRVKFTFRLICLKGGEKWAILLKKIEELILCRVEQDKTKKKQSDLYNELKQEMAELKALIKSR